MPAILPALENLEFVREIAANDWMAKKQTPDWYYRRGYEALTLINNECTRNQVAPNTILDFGCGHGNVARMLKAIYPKAKIVGQDVNPDWLAWCTEHLGIDVIQSADRIEDVEIAAEQYDLIWVGSVFTHIPSASATYLLTQLARGLRPKGLLILTSAGQRVADGFQPGKEPFLNPEAATKALQQYRKGDYGFVPYEGGKYQDWGRALINFDWMYIAAKCADLQLVGFQAGGWGMRQDVYSFKRPA